MKNLELVTKDNCHKYTEDDRQPLFEEPENFGLLVTIGCSFALGMGVWLGFFCAAMNIYYQCAKGDKWEYTNFLMKDKFEASCTVKK